MGIIKIFQLLMFAAMFAVYGCEPKAAELSETDLGLEPEKVSLTIDQAVEPDLMVYGPGSVYETAYRLFRLDKLTFKNAHVNADWLARYAVYNRGELLKDEDGSYNLFNLHSDYCGYGCQSKEGVVYYKNYKAAITNLFDVMVSRPPSEGGYNDELYVDIADYFYKNGLATKKDLDAVTGIQLYYVSKGV